MADDLWWKIPLFNIPVVIFIVAFIVLCFIWYRRRQGKKKPTESSTKTSKKKVGSQKSVMPASKKSKKSVAAPPSAKPDAPAAPEAAAEEKKPAAEKPTGTTTEDKGKEPAAREEWQPTELGGNWDEAGRHRFFLELEAEGNRLKKVRNVRPETQVNFDFLKDANEKQRQAATDEKVAPKDPHTTLCLDAPEMSAALDNLDLNERLRAREDVEPNEYFNMCSEETLKGRRKDWGPQQLGAELDEPLTDEQKALIEARKLHQSAIARHLARGGYMFGANVAHVEVVAETKFDVITETPEPPDPHKSSAAEKPDKHSKQVKKQRSSRDTKETKVTLDSKTKDVTKDRTRDKETKEATKETKETKE
ncbi:unnamed protein product, partial [Mesorhabditis spiculigera]